MPIDCAKIKRLRERLNLTQDQAAELAGMGGRQNWNGVESGLRKNVTIDTIERMAVALGVKAKDLLK